MAQRINGEGVGSVVGSVVCSVVLSERLYRNRSRDMGQLLNVRKTRTASWGILWYCIAMCCAR